MTAALNQDFVTYKGDTPKPIFTVQDSSGAVVDISTCLEITWWVKQEAEDAVALLTKTKTLGAITFVTDGKDGKFQVALLAADTQALSGYYLHQASIKDGNNNITTVSVGRMQVGAVPSWTYNPAQLSTNPVYQVRRIIGDVLYGDQQMQDDEIQYFITTYGSTQLAASYCCRALSAQFSRLVDTVQGELHTLYGQRAKNYSAMATQLEVRARGSISYGYAGGISQADKINAQEDSDRVSPAFLVRMFDDLLPVAPAGQQSPSAPMPDSPGNP